jgi:hypothetical protein
MRKVAAVHRADGPVRASAVCSRGVPEQESVADPAPAGSSVGRAAVPLAFHSEVSTVGCRAVQVRHSATVQKAELAQLELVLLPEPANQESPQRRVKRRRSQIAKT